MQLVQPRLSRGLRDLLPEDTLARQAMIDVIRKVFETYGFVPITTPAVEYLDVLSGSGGKEIQEDRKSTRLNSSHVSESRMPSSA